MYLDKCIHLCKQKVPHLKLRTFPSPQKTPSDPFPVSSFLPCPGKLIYNYRLNFMWMESYSL